MDVVNIFLMILTFRGALTHPSHEIREKEILAQDGQFPHQVLIRSKYGDHYPICNGILLEVDFVLTTAGCVKRYETSAEDLEVAAGGLRINMTSSDDEHVQESYVRNVIIHPLWHLSGGKSADLALLEIYPEMKETSFIKRAQIAELRTSAVNISGWSDEENLVFLDGYMYNENCCINFFDEEPRSTFCIVSSKGRKLLSKKNYAGASVGSAESIYGIISTSNPGFATSISRYQTWIRDLTKRHRATTLRPSTQDDWTETTEDESEETYETTDDDEETDESQETDDETYDSEETDESKIWTDETEEESEESDETDETDDTDETDETEESERPSRHTTPTYKTTRARPSTSPNPMTDEASEETEESDETSDETDETEETDESEESKIPSRHTTPTYRTSSTSPKPTTDEVSEESEESDETSEETEETEESSRPTRYTTPPSGKTYRTIPFRPSTSPRPMTDETSEETDETSDETEETEESSRPTRYTTPPSGKTYKTIPFRPSTSPSPMTDITTEETDETSDEIEETEESSQPTTSTTLPSSNTYRTRPFKPSTSPRPMTDETSEETDETSHETDQTENSSSTEQFESSSSSYSSLVSNSTGQTTKTSTIPYSDISSTKTEDPQPIIPEFLESGTPQLTVNIFVIFFSSIVIKYFL